MALRVTTAGVTLARQFAPATDTPPTISSTPTPPSFTEGTSGTYDMTQHVSDDGVSTVTYSLTNVLPVGLSFVSATGILTYDGIGIPTVSQHALQATDDVGTAESSLFNITVQEVVIVPTVVMDGWPFITATQAIGNVINRTTVNPSAKIIAYTNLFTSQALFMLDSAQRLATRNRLDALWAINPDLHVIYHIDYLTVRFDVTSTPTPWLENVAWNNSGIYDDFFLRSSSSGPFISHYNYGGWGLAYNWGQSDANIQLTVDRQIADWTDFDGGNGCINFSRPINWMQDTVPIIDSRYFSAGTGGLVSRVESSTEIDIPAWSWTGRGNTVGDGVIAGDGFEGMLSNKESSLVCMEANGSSGDFAKITDFKRLVTGSTDRVRIQNSLENMSISSGDHFSILPVAGSGSVYGSSESGELSQSQWRLGIQNFATKIKETVKANYAVDIDGYCNMGAVNASSKRDGRFTTYPHDDVGKWAGFQYERIGQELGLFQVGHSTYRSVRDVGVGGSAGGRTYNEDNLMESIYYNVDMLKPDAECATGYATLWLNAQCRSFGSNQGNYFAGLDDLDAAAMRFWCCTAWTLENVAPQIEVDEGHDVPIMIDEAIIDAGQPISTRSYGTYDESADSGKGGFTWDTPDFGTYGYVKKFTNCWIIINFRKPNSDPWIPSWMPGGQNITSNDTWTVTGVPVGKKLQRFNRATYINNRSGSKFFGLGPTDFDDVDILKDAAFNNGSDVGATFDCGPLECAVLMLVDE